jgi:plasmid replication initiation protein
LYEFLGNYTSKMEETNNLNPISDINEIIRLDNTEHFFVQSNSLIEARSHDSLTFLEKIIFAKMCTMIDPQDTDFIEYTIFVRDMIDLLGITDSGRAYQNILEAAKKLKSRGITIVVKNKETGREEILETNLVIGIKRAKITKEERDLYVKLAFHPDLKPYLLRLKNNFTLLDIRNFVRLHSGSTMRIYELLKQYENTNSKQREIPLETLKSMLGVTDKYKLYGGFKQKILDEAQRRINESTDIHFTYEEVKKGKKVTSIRFKISKKLTQKTISVGSNVVQEPKPMSEAAQNQLFDEIYISVKDWGITASTLLRLVNDYSAEVLRTAVRLTQKNQKLGKIKGNAAGFFVTAVKEGFVDSTEKAMQDREKRRDAAVVKRQHQENKEQKVINEKVELVQKQTALALSLVQNDEILRQNAIVKLQQGLVGRTVYNSKVSFEENLKSPLFVSAFVSAVMSISPDDFEF